MDFSNAKMFDFEKIYDQVVMGASDGAKFLEIGCCVGGSSTYMINQILKSGKNIEFYTTDPWPDYVLYQCPDYVVKRGLELTNDNYVYMLYLDNLKKKGILEYVTPIKLKSEVSAQLFDDGELDFVMIDGDHSYDGVKIDLEKYIPKVKVGGIIAGHDYLYTYTQRAVHEFLREDEVYLYYQRDTNFSKESTSFVTRKTQNGFEPYIIN